MPIYTNGLLNGPQLVNAILADSGAFSGAGGVNFPAIWASANVTAQITFEQIDGSSNVVWSHTFFCNLGGSPSLPPPIDNPYIYVSVGDRIRLRLSAAILTGSVQGTLIF